MFTGIIEAIGRVRHIESSGGDYRLSIDTGTLDMDDVKPGDTIITSNFSNKYPKEIPVGFVERTLELPGDIYMRIEVKPFVNLATLEQVFILKYIPDPERLKLIRGIDEKLRIRMDAAKK